MSHLAMAYQPFFLGVLSPAFVRLERRLHKQFLCLRGLGAARLFDFKIHGYLLDSGTVGESSLFFCNHHYPLDVDFHCFAETLRGVISDVKNMERSLP
jgi:hypothetical protein